MLSLWKPYNLFFDVFDSSYGLEYKKKDDNSLDLAVDLPGVEEKDVSVEVTPDNYLHIKGERKTKTSSYTVSKTFFIPKQYDTDHILAELKNGVLSLTLPSKVLGKENKKVNVITK